ncbi:hypothetical protein M7I_4308 [Glarea lozoyensis 74030]|uniref:Uncharacterized protein n=1 Tax=Glarea lozoyensis (strain ATCC 74030 / MF5533) TaxID=1104152 RepID=H0ENU5_GLAL7|nr:hypothetical protein M7I_4308 [Glarea lozoyensis 74030]
MVANTDAHFYNNFMRDLEGLKYTVVFSTTPSDTLAADEITYEPTFDVGVHMDLKRALLTRAPAPTASNDTRPLFEKYQYFTPEVSYGAFEKEMGPAAQKKAQ